MRPPHDLEVYPTQIEGIEFRFNGPAPEVVAPDRCGEFFRREDPHLRIIAESLRPPEFDRGERVGRIGREPSRPRGFRAVELAPVNPLLDRGMIFLQVLPLQRNDFTGMHSCKNRQPDGDLFPEVQDAEDLLDLFGIQHIA